jgi:hypothetical protein
LLSLVVVVAVHTPAVAAVAAEPGAIVLHTIVKHLVAVGHQKVL